MEQEGQFLLPGVIRLVEQHLSEEHQREVGSGAAAVLSINRKLSVHGRT